LKASSGSANDGSWEGWGDEVATPPAAEERKEKVERPEVKLVEDDWVWRDESTPTKTEKVTPTKTSSARKAANVAPKKAAVVASDDGWDNWD
jgi:hypothetical protein